MTTPNFQCGQEANYRCYGACSAQDETYCEYVSCEDCGTPVRAADIEPGREYLCSSCEDEHA